LTTRFPCFSSHLCPFFSVPWILRDYCRSVYRQCVALPFFPLNIHLHLPPDVGEAQYFPRVLSSFVQPRRNSFCFSIVKSTFLSDRRYLLPIFPSAINNPARIVRILYSPTGPLDPRCFSLPFFSCFFLPWIVLSDWSAFLSGFLVKVIVARQRRGHPLLDVLKALTAIADLPP